MWVGELVEKMDSEMVDMMVAMLVLVKADLMVARWDIESVEMSVGPMVWKDALMAVMWVDELVVM